MRRDKGFTQHHFNKNGIGLPSTTFFSKKNNDRVYPAPLFCQQKSGAGFTLIELVIIVTILGILAVAVLMSGTAKGPIRLEAACQKLAMDLRYVQQMAMAEQVRFGILFDTGDESYFGYRVSTATKATDPHTQNDLEVDFDQMREFNEIVITSTNFSDAIEFDSIGAPYDGNGVPLSSEGVVTLSDGSNSKIVKIEPATGKVSIQ